MADTNKKTVNKKAIIGVVIFALVVVVMGVLYSTFKEKPVEGSKAIVIEVIDDQQVSTVYELKTDAEYLQQAMDEAEGLTYEGEETEYGLTVLKVNGVEADFNTSGAYWSFYVNEGYCNYGISAQPVEDGDHFQIVYEVYVAE